MTLQIYSCGLVDLESTTTNENGYYAFGGLQNRSYAVVSENDNYTFDPTYITLQIPQAVIQSYDFTAEIDLCSTVDRFLDNNDGTVTDCRTDLIWLQNASCYGEQVWSNAMASAAGLNSGECGLSDGSAEGDWHLATKDEFQGIGIDPPVTWDSGNPPVAWTVPGSPFVSVANYVYWLSPTCASDTQLAPFAIMNSGFTDCLTNHQPFYSWPVRSDN